MQFIKLIQYFAKKNNMKPCFLLLLMSLSFLDTLSAQYYRHSISAGYGVLTFQDVASVTTDIIVSVASAEVIDVSSSGVLYVEYSYYRTNHWRFVLDANYIKVKSTFVQGPNQQPYGNGEDIYYSGMIGVNYHWIADAFIELYSGLQLGASYVKSRQDYVGGTEATDNIIFPAFQITGLGLRVGKKFGGFAEAGFGNKGILNAGLDLRF